MHKPVQVLHRIPRRSVFGWRQHDTLTKACDSLLLFNNRERGYLTDPQRLVLKEAWQVLSALKQNHIHALKAVREHEKDSYLVTEKANCLLQVMSAGLDVAGKVALLGHPLSMVGERHRGTNPR